MSCKPNTRPNGKRSMELKREHEEWRILTIAVRKKANGESVYARISGGGILVSNNCVSFVALKALARSLLPRSSFLRS